MFHCDNCGHEVVRSYSDGKIKCRTNIIIWENGKKAVCKCPKCHNDVLIPVVLKLPTGKVYGDETEKYRASKKT